MLSKTGSEHNVQVNSVCPGWMKTVMSGPDAMRTVEKGAETIVWLALKPDGSETGLMRNDKGYLIYD